MVQLRCRILNFDGASMLDRVQCMMDIDSLRQVFAILTFSVAKMLEHAGSELLSIHLL